MTATPFPSLLAGPSEPPYAPWTILGIKNILANLGYSDHEMHEVPGKVTITIYVARWYWWLALGLVHRRRRKEIARALEPGRAAGVRYVVKVR